MMKKILIFVVLVIVIILAIFLAKKGSDSDVTGSPAPSNVYGKDFTYDDLPEKASCSIGGTLKFLSANTYEHAGDYFRYVGVDDHSRLINWTLEPDDDIDVGPNIFDRMPLPDGESLVDVFLPENPKAKKYTLTAQVGYGRLDENNVLRNFVADCDGTLTVDLSNI